MQIDTSAEHLYVCTGSGELFGPLGPNRATPTHEQRCRWPRCPYRDRRWHRRRTALPQPPGDFACAVELCHCCASALIPSGSKFSSFFCDECGTAVRQLRESVGFAVIPLGRHSIMNSMSLSGTDARDPQRVAEFASAVQHSFDRMDRLFLWQRGVVADRAAAMRPAVPCVSVPEYLAFTGQHGLPRPEMFQQLCRFFGTEP